MKDKKIESSESKEVKEQVIETKKEDNKELEELRKFKAEVEAKQKAE
jgi:hypothetical protein